MTAPMPPADVRKLVGRLRASAAENYEMLGDIHLLLTEAADAIDAYADHRRETREADAMMERLA